MILVRNVNDEYLLRSSHGLGKQVRQACDLHSSGALICTSSFVIGHFDGVHCNHGGLCHHSEESGHSNGDIPWLARSAGFLLGVNMSTLQWRYNLVDSCNMVGDTCLEVTRRIVYLTVLWLN